MPADRQTLVKQLRALRQGRGLTIASLNPHMELRETLGLIEIETQLELLKSAVGELGTDRHATALRVAFNIDPGLAASLTDRRQHYADALGMSARSIINWEDSMIEQLADKLNNSVDYRGELLAVQMHADVVNFHVKSLWYAYTYSKAGVLSPNVAIHRNPDGSNSMVPIFVSWPNLQVLRIELHYVEGTPPDYVYQNVHESLEDWSLNLAVDHKRWEPINELNRIEIAFPSYQHYYLFFGSPKVVLKIRTQPVFRFVRKADPLKLARILSAPHRAPLGVPWARHQISKSQNL